MIDEDQSPPDARAVKREEESEREIEAFNTTRVGPQSTLDDRGYIVLGSASSCLGTYLLVCWLPLSTLARPPVRVCPSLRPLPAGSLPGGGASAVRSRCSQVNYVAFLPRA